MSIRGIHTWNGSCSARWPWLLVVLFAVVALVLGLTLHWVWFFYAVAGAILLFFTRLDVTVDLDGMTVRFGPFGWPKKRLALNDMTNAESIDLNPWKWGGWGYRWLPRRGSAAVLRRGPAIVVTRANGKKFAVTVDDAPLGAVTLQSHIDALPPR